MNGERALIFADYANDGGGGHRILADPEYVPPRGTDGFAHGGDVFGVGQMGREDETGYRFFEPQNQGFPDCAFAWDVLQ